MNNNIEKLRELTPKLSNMALSYIDHTEYTAKDGAISFGFPLLYEESIAVQRTYRSKNTGLEKHAHNEREWLIVYMGKLIVTMHNEDITIGVGEYVFIPENVVHSVYAVDNTWALCVTIPAEESYPHGTE